MPCGTQFLPHLQKWGTPCSRLVEVSKGLRLVFAGELMIIISTIVELACSVLAATLSGSYSSLIPGDADRAVTAPAVILNVLALAGGSAILCGIILNIIGFRYLFRRTGISGSPSGSPWLSSRS